MSYLLVGFIVRGGECVDTMGLDDLEGFLRQKGAPELVTEIGTGTATFNALVDAVAVSSSTVSSRFIRLQLRLTPRLCSGSECLL